MELLMWEKSQALYYYKQLVEAVADKAARREAQALALRDIAFAALSIAPGTQLEPDLSWEELSSEERVFVASHFRQSESFRAQGVILSRKLVYLKGLQENAILKFREIKPL